MNPISSFTRILSFVTAALIASQQIGFAAAAITGLPGLPQQNVMQQTVDVELDGHGMLRGQVVDAEGIPVSGISVSLIGANDSAVAARTDLQGQFAFAGNRGGEFLLQVGDTQRHVRVWSAGTAPPAAQSAVLLIPDPTTVRGHGHGHKHRGHKHHGHKHGHHHLKKLLPFVIFGGALAWGITEAS